MNIFKLWKQAYSKYLNFILILYYNLLKFEPIFKNLETFLMISSSELNILLVLIWFY